MESITFLLHSFRLGNRFLCKREHLNLLPGAHLTKPRQGVQGVQLHCQHWGGGNRRILGACWKVILDTL